IYVEKSEQPLIARTSCRVRESLGPVDGGAAASQAWQRTQASGGQHHANTDSCGRLDLTVPFSVYEVQSSARFPVAPPRHPEGRVLERKFLSRGLAHRLHSHPEFSAGGFERRASTVPRRDRILPTEHRRARD